MARNPRFRAPIRDDASPFSAIYLADGAAGARTLLASLSKGPGTPTPAASQAPAGPAALTGTSGNDTLIGQANQHDFIEGLAGNDFINGRAGVPRGVDELHGGPGDDIIYGYGYAIQVRDTVETAFDLIVERPGEGYDIVYVPTQFFELSEGAEVELIAMDDPEATKCWWIRGNEFDNHIITDAGDNYLDGKGGNDVMAGRRGNDFYFVDDAGDVVMEESGEGIDEILTSVSYTLPENVEEIWVSADEGTLIELTGNRLDNSLRGHRGANVLDGREGTDLLAGVNGADVFAFTTALGAANIDAIADFQPSSDCIALFGGPDGPFAALEPGVLSVNAFVRGTGATAAEHRIIYDPANGRLYYDADGVGGAAAIQFATLNNRAAIEAWHFVVADLSSDSDNDVRVGSDSVDDMLAGLAGNDVLDGRGGNDTTDGGTGNDLHYVDQAGDVVIERIGEGSDRVYARTSYVLTAGSHVEILSTANDSGTDVINLGGNELDNVIYGNAGNNTLTGGAGNDFLFGWLGVNVLVGGLGDDIYHVGYGSDAIIENAGEGQDRVLAGTDYTLADGVWIEILSTDFHAGTAPIALGGNELDNIIFGNAGANILYGKAGNDQLIGLAGSDSYYVETAGDQVFEAAGEGSDRVFASADYTLYAGQSIEILSTDDNAGTVAINLGGNELDNIIYGNAGANILYGKGGNDWLEGLSGDDQYFIDSAGDYVREVAGGGADRILAGGDYTLYAGQSVEILSTDNNAGTAAIALGGNELDNIIYGNDGANILYGKEGNDTLLGLGGNDQFWFNTTLGATNVDAIYGFASGADKLVLFQSVFAGLSPGGLSASAFVTGSGAQDADDRIVYNSATGALLYDADGSGAGAAIQFATLNGAPVINAGDFSVI